MMHSAQERTHRDPAEVLHRKANPRIFGTGKMRACVAVLDGIRCGLNSSPYRLATVSRFMVKTNSYRESVISYQTNQSDHSPQRR